MKYGILSVFLFCVSLFGYTPEDILEYWLGTVEERVENPTKNCTVWFNGGEVVDQEILRKFEPLYRDARFGRLEFWKKNPRGRLALILILDQFPRNMYRGSGEAFLTDSLALNLVLEGIEKGDDRSLTAIERAFFYMPLEHAEDSKTQELSVELFSRLVEDAEPIFQFQVEQFLEYAIRHREVIDRFGRYPHRNQALNRVSNPDEEEYLNERGSGF